MSTTALIVEILVIGCFSLIWIIINLLNIYNVTLQEFGQILIKYKDWSTALILFTIAVCYLLGWVMNLFSYFLMKKSLHKYIISKILKKDTPNYDKIKFRVFHEGSANVYNKIKEELSVVRLIRSASINFLLISISIFLYGKWDLGTVILLVSLICFLEYLLIYNRYVSRIYISYKIIQKKKNNKHRKEST